MIPVLTGKQVRKLDQLAIESYGIPSLDLMEAAGRGAFEFLEQVYPLLKKSRVLVVCGKGNNGGDAFVLARYLAKEWVQTTIATVTPLKELSPDAATMAKRLKSTGVKIISAAKLSRLESLLDDCDLIVDGLLGTGLKQGARSPYKEWIERINQIEKPVFALDIPSGLLSDGRQIKAPVVSADWTATFAFMKQGLAVQPGCNVAGDVQVIDIGMPAELIKKVRTKLRLVTKESVRSAFQERKADTHKGSYGHVLVVAGSVTKLGAALMTSKSVLRSGAGLVTLALPQKAFTKIPSQFLEIMYEPLASDREGLFAASALSPILSLAQDKSVMAIGPGMGVTTGIRRLLAGLIKESPIPMLIDADGLNALIGQTEVLKQAKQAVVLTPHPGELARLMGLTTRELQRDRIKIAQDFASQHDVTVVLKGSRTLCALPDGKVYINPTGNAAMATAGMGDVLTGIISAYLAQGIQWRSAITAAVYIHGLAGDRLAERMGDRGLLAGDVIDSLPFIMKEFVGTSKRIKGMSS